MLGLQGCLLTLAVLVDVNQIRRAPVRGVRPWALHATPDTNVARRFRGCRRRWRCRSQAVARVDEQIRTAICELARRVGRDLLPCNLTVSLWTVHSSSPW